MATLHLELAQGSRRSIDAAGVPYGAPSIDGCKKLCDTRPIKLLGSIDGYTELNRSQFVMLSPELGEAYPYMSGREAQVLKDICLVANCSEEFCLSVSKDQCLRTAIICDKKDPSALFSSQAVKIKDWDPSLNALFPDAVSITIHSQVVPYWPKLQATRDYFSSTLLDSVLSDKKSLIEMSNDSEGKECAFLKKPQERGDDEESDQPRAGRPFWNIGSGDVEVVKSKSEQGSQAYVEEILWRGGIFAQKVFLHEEEFYAELKIVRRVSHPHIVYSFGVSISTEKQHSLLMERLDGDLFKLITERVRVEHHIKPPFSRPDSVHILLQVAKAMVYIHGLDEPLIHGDLKPQNILVSRCEILGGVCQYFVKVADFGSAKFRNPGSTFEPDNGTTNYAAPEVLKWRLEKNLVIDCPQKIDIYSFGIVAFQVLTGLEPYKKSLTVLVEKEGVKGLVPYEGVSKPSEIKKGVMAGTLRPPLLEACSRPNFWSDRRDLTSLVASCWHPEASARPHFLDVASRLESIYNDLTKKPRSGSNVHPSFQAIAVSDNSSQVFGLQSVHDNPKKAPRRKKGHHGLSLPCTSGGKTSE